MLIRGAAGSNPTTANFYGGSYEGSPPSGNVVANYAGSLNFFGTKFASGTNTIFKVGDINTPASFAAFSAIGCFFQNNVPLTTMVIDSSNNDALAPTSNATGKALTKILMLNNVGGIPGAAISLQNVVPTGARSLQASPYVPAGSPATYTAIGAPNRTMSAAVLPYTLFKANAANQAIQVFGLPPRTRLTSVIVDVTVAFTGPPSAPTMEVGQSPADNAFMLNKSVASVTQWGLSNADLGALLAPAVSGATWTVPVQGGFVSSAFWTADNPIYVTLLAGSVLGNGTTTNFTAGSLTIYIETERF
jgi:hypothetical protein